MFSILRGDIPFSVAGSDWLPVLWLGLINTGLGCFFYFSSIGKLPAQTVAVCGYIEPLSAVLLSTIVLNERMLPLRFLGAALIIGGALYGEIAAGSKIVKTNICAIAHEKYLTQVTASGILKAERR